MEYHSDRYQDYSLLVYKDKKLVALLPANYSDDAIYSHQGLTYGGLIVDKQSSFNTILESFKNCLVYLNKNGFKTLLLKLIPEIYLTYPSSEMNYLLFVIDAKLHKREISSTIYTQNKLSIQQNRIQGKRKGKKYNLIIKEEESFDTFWNEILIPNLSKKYNTDPTHSLKEISLLKSRFPRNIRQFNVYYKNEVVAGATIFETRTVAHTQYISANNDKQKLGSLDYLFEYLINVTFKDKMYFDFGTSNQNSGKQINKGLQFWKEGFGARGIVHDFYKVDLKNVKKLETVFV